MIGSHDNGKASSGQVVAPLTQGDDNGQQDGENGGQQGCCENGAAQVGDAVIPDVFAINENAPASNSLACGALAYLVEAVASCLKNTSTRMPVSSGGSPSRSTIASSTSTSFGRRGPRETMLGCDSDWAMELTRPSKS